MGEHGRGQFVKTFAQGKAGRAGLFKRILPVGTGLNGCAAGERGGRIGHGAKALLGCGSVSMCCIQYGQCVYKILFSQVTDDPWVCQFLK